MSKGWDNWQPGESPRFSDWPEALAWPQIVGEVTEHQDVRVRCRGVTYVVAGGDVGVGLVGGRGVTGGGSRGAVRHGQEGGQHNLQEKIIIRKNLCKK